MRILKKISSSTLFTFKSLHVIRHGYEYHSNGKCYGMHSKEEGNSDADCKSLISNIDKCLITMMNYYRSRKEQEFNESLFNLKLYCSQLNQETERKVTEKSWNYVIQHFCRNDLFHDEAIYWFMRIMREKKLANPNSFTLNSMLKVVSLIEDAKVGEICEEILQELERQGQVNLYSYVYYSKACLKNGKHLEAFNVIERMEKNEIVPSFGIYIPLLQEATNNSNIPNGLNILEKVESSNLSNAKLSSTIIAFALKVGMPDIAIKERQKLKRDGVMNIITWTSLIQAYIQKKEIKKALSILSEMKEGGISSDSTLFTILLGACSSSPEFYEDGKRIHELAKKTLSCFSIELSTSIIDFYTKCGYPDMAIEEFKILKERDRINTASWNCLIQAYIQKNDIWRAINILKKMKECNFEPDSITFVILLTACSLSPEYYEQGKLIHELAKKTLKIFSIELSNSILNFYTKCGYPDISINEFYKLPRSSTSVASWNCLIQAYIQQKEIKKALNIFEEMRGNVSPNYRTITILLSACSSPKLFGEGQSILEFAKKTMRDEYPIELSNTIMNFYSACGFPNKSIEYFENTKRTDTDILSWNCLIQAYVQKEINTDQLLSILNEMKENEIKPDSTTFTIILSTCSSPESFEDGKLFHEMAMKSLSNFSIELSSAILSFYSKCGYPDLAIEQFEKIKMNKTNIINVRVLNCLIQAYIEKHDIKRAISILNEMKECKIEPDSITFIVLLNACCTSPEFYEDGKNIFEVAKKTLMNFSIELWNTLLKFYTKCGNLDDLQKSFDIYQEMKLSQNPDSITYNLMLAACGEYVACETGLKIIEDIKSNGMDCNEEVTSAMINFYSRIGDQELAQQLFDKFVKKMNYSKQTLSIITYGNMLACFAQQGKGKEAEQLFNEMVEKNVELNEIIFMILLNAYSHSGMVQEAIDLYDEMKSKHGFTPTKSVECVMVDMYSRAGRFKEAEELIGNRNDIELWSVLMGGCRKFNNIEMGEKVFNKIICVDELNASAYVLLSHIYAFHHFHEKAERIRDLMQKRGIKRIPGIVYHEENGKLYEFISGSNDYERFEETEKTLKDIYCRIIEEGFIPDTRWVTNPKLLTEQEKLNSLSKHAEKIAIAHAFVLNPNRKKIVMVTKNLRVCNDCHNAISFISKVMNVEIIIRDTSRYHHFKNGKCTCDEYIGNY